MSGCRGLVSVITRIKHFRLEIRDLPAQIGIIIVSLLMEIVRKLFWEIQWDCCHNFLKFSFLIFSFSSIVAAGGWPRLTQNWNKVDQTIPEPNWSQIFYKTYPRTGMTYTEGESCGDHPTMEDHHKGRQWWGSDIIEKYLVSIFCTGTVRQVLSFHR